MMAIVCVWAKVTVYVCRIIIIINKICTMIFISFSPFHFQNGGGEIERNDSGVGSETSGTAQRLRRMRRLNKSSHHHQSTTGGSSTTTAITSPTNQDGQDGPAATPWCVDCDQPIEPDQEE